MILEIDGVIVNEEGTRRLLEEILHVEKQQLEELRHIRRLLEPPKAQSATLTIKEN